MLIILAVGSVHYLKKIGTNKEAISMMKAHYLAQKAHFNEYNLYNQDPSKIGLDLNDKLVFVYLRADLPQEYNFSFVPSITDSEYEIVVYSRDDSSRKFWVLNSKGEISELVGDKKTLIERLN